MTDEKVLIFDTTLRDGEQSAGIGLTTQEKLDIAKQLERLGLEYLRPNVAVETHQAQVGARERLAYRLLRLSSADGEAELAVQRPRGRVDVRVRIDPRRETQQDVLDHPGLRRQPVEEFEL